MTGYRQIRMRDADGRRLFAGIRRDKGIVLTTYATQGTSRGVLSRDNVETLVQMLIEAGEPMKYSLLNKLRSLETENTQLKNKVGTLELGNATLKDNAALLEAEKEFVGAQLDKVNVAHVNLQLDAQRTEFELQNQLEKTQKARKNDAYWLQIKNSELKTALEENTKLKQEKEKRRSEEAQRLALLTVHDEVIIEVEKSNPVVIKKLVPDDYFGSLLPILVGTTILAGGGWSRGGASKPKTVRKDNLPTPQLYKEWEAEIERYRKIRQDKQNKQGRLA